MAKQKEQEAGAQAVEVEEGGGLLDQILTEGRLGRDEFQKERAKDMIGEFVGQVMSGELTMSKNMDVAINSRIAEIDRLISAQMNEIMHHEIPKARGLVARPALHGQKHDHQSAVEDRVMSVTRKTFKRL